MHIILASIPLIVAVIVTVYLFIKRRAGLAGTVIACFLFVTFLGFGTSALVRLDTGDQRQLLWGIPIRQMPMYDSPRQALLLLHDPEIREEWTWCAQQLGSNNADLMVYSFYGRAAAWVDVDPEIAKLLVRDIANYVRTTHAMQGLPNCSGMIGLNVDQDHEHDRWRVIEGWQSKPEVIDYLAAHGYVLDPKTKRAQKTGRDSVDSTLPSE